MRVHFRFGDRERCRRTRRVCLVALTLLGVSTITGCGPGFIAWLKLAGAVFTAFSGNWPAGTSAKVTAKPTDATKPSRTYTGTVSGGQITFSFGDGLSAEQQCTLAVHTPGEGERCLQWTTAEAKGGSSTWQATVSPTALRASAPNTSTVTLASGTVALPQQVPVLTDPSVPPTNSPTNRTPLALTTGNLFVPCGGTADPAFRGNANLHIYLLVRNYTGEPASYYLQNGETDVSSTGLWTSNFQLGNNAYPPQVGQPFDVSLVVVEGAALPQGPVGAPRKKLESQYDVDRLRFVSEPVYYVVGSID